MIASENRFHGYGSLRYAHQKGKVIRGPNCALKYVRNDRRKTYRVAVVVSKKVNKSAVVRNRIRRRVYEAVRKSVAPSASYDLIITVFNDQLAHCSPKEVHDMIAGKFRAAGVPQITDN